MNAEQIIKASEDSTYKRMLRHSIHTDFFGGIRVDPNKVPVTMDEARKAIAAFNSYKKVQDQLTKAPQP